MKRFFALLAALCLLAGCAAGTEEREPVWQTGTRDGGTVSISGCTLSGEETGTFLYYPGDPLPLERPLLHLTGKSAPTVTLTGVDESAATLLFAEHADDGTWVGYVPVAPVEELDYVLTRGEDGSLCYRLDTVYSYAVAIGPELWILDVAREGL